MADWLDAGTRAIVTAETMLRDLYGDQRHDDDGRQMSG